MVTALLSAAALQGWEDKNLVTLKEADGTGLPPSPTWLQGDLQKEGKSLRVTGLSYKTTRAFPSELK